MSNKTEFVSPIRLKQLLGDTSRIKTSGVFKTSIDKVAHLEAFLVTFIGNEEDSPHYDSDYPIEGTCFELVSGNEAKSFDFASELKFFMTKHLELNKAKPSASIILG
jgi:hypothetical protein